MPRKTQTPATTTLSLDRETLKTLKYLAVEKETTVRELIRTAIHEFLKKKKEARP